MDRKTIVRFIDIYNEVELFLEFMVDDLRLGFEFKNKEDAKEYMLGLLETDRAGMTLSLLETLEEDGIAIDEQLTRMRLFLFSGFHPEQMN